MVFLCLLIAGSLLPPSPGPTLPDWTLQLDGVGFSAWLDPSEPPADRVSLVLARRRELAPEAAATLRRHLSWEAGIPYDLRLEARSAEPTRVQMQSRDLSPPWAPAGLAESFMLDKEWKSFRFSWTPAHSVPQGIIEWRVSSPVSAIDIRQFQCEPAQSGPPRGGSP
jgi:hypothetical protein